MFHLQAVVDEWATSLFKVKDTLLSQVGFHVFRRHFHFYS